MAKPRATSCNLKRQFLLVHYSRLIRLILVAAAALLLVPSTINFSIIIACRIRAKDILFRSLSALKQVSLFTKVFCWLDGFKHEEIPFVSLHFLPWPFQSFRPFFFENQTYILVIWRCWELEDYYNLKRLWMKGTHISSRPIFPPIKIQGSIFPPFSCSQGSTFPPIWKKITQGSIFPPLFWIQGSIFPPFFIPQQ